MSPLDAPELFFTARTAPECTTTNPSSQLQCWDEFSERTHESRLSCLEEKPPCSAVWVEGLNLLADLNRQHSVNAKVN